jgi:hypothetical protein
MLSRAIRPFMPLAAALPLMFAVAPAGLRATQAQKVALVTVVADASGPVKDLTAKDFVVTEDKATRDVVEARLADAPLSIALLVDTTVPPLGVTPPTQDLRTSLAGFVKALRAASPDVKISMAEFSGASVETVKFDALPLTLDQAVAKVYPNQPGNAVLLEALVDGAKRLANQPPPRRALVSVDFNSQEGSAERTMKNAADEVHKAGATLWAVSMRGTAPQSVNREEVLNKITAANGGLRLTSIDASGLQPNLMIVANSLLSQYEITFTRTGNDKPKSTTFATAKGGKVLQTPWMR